MNVAEKLSLLLFPETKETDKLGMTPISVRMTIAGFPRKEFSTGIKIDTKTWDKKDWRVTGKSLEVDGLTKE